MRCTGGVARRAGRRDRGFTLLEMVVVLAIMALVIGVASVRIFSMIESWRVRSQLDGIEGQFAHLPVMARREGIDIVLPPPASSASSPAADPAEAVDTADARSDVVGFKLPDDWKITFDKPLRVRSNGFCEGADILIEHDGRRYPRRVTAPFCQVAELSGSGS